MPRYRDREIPLQTSHSGWGFSAGRAGTFEAAGRIVGRTGAPNAIPHWCSPAGNRSGPSLRKNRFWKPSSPVSRNAIEFHFGARGHSRKLIRPRDPQTRPRGSIILAREPSEPEESRKTVVSDVATAYLTLRELDYKLEISQRTLATREESLRLTGHALIAHQRLRESREKQEALVKAVEDRLRLAICAIAGESTRS